jgi:AraC family transcriptional regulator
LTILAVVLTGCILRLSSTDDHGSDIRDRNPSMTRLLFAGRFGAPSRQATSEKFELARANGMNTVQAQRQEDLLYVTQRSSSGLGWTALRAEIRDYPRFEGSVPVAPMAKIALVLGGSGDGYAAFKIGRNWRSTQTTPGRIWLRPIGGKYDEYRISSTKVEVLDLFLPTAVFTQLSDDYNLPTALDASVRHEGGVQDEVINQVGLALLSEMMSPTSAGRMLVETSSLLLAARLVHAHLDSGTVRLPIQSRPRLDNRRLKRVLDYLEEHLCDDIALADLANIACLSIFHFNRAFSAATGKSPHRYVSQRRLEWAKAMIAVGRTSIAETAFLCRFSSQSSFTRAFRRATGMTPAGYRRASGL